MANILTPAAKLRVVELLDDFVSLFYPLYCYACEEGLVKGEELICTRCLSQLPKTDFHCHADNALARKLQGRLPINHALALYKFQKDGRVQELLHVLKYNDRPEIGERLGRMYGATLADSGLSNAFDIIVPVPLHWSKQRQRGYNQSTEFCKGLSTVLNTPYHDRVVERTVPTETQTRRSKADRWKNVSEVFSVLEKEEVRDKRVLLVDDVVTTGATLEACGRPLVETGCKSLSVACIAMAI